MDCTFPFRFGLSVWLTGDRREWLDTARWAEDNGFASLQVPDHLAPMCADPWAALGAAAAVTSTITLGTYVINDSFQSPALTARSVASLDVLSGGRAELGVGAGHMAAEFEFAGLPFASAGARIDRLEASVTEIASLLEEAAAQADEGAPPAGVGIAAPVRRPRPPILVGGNARRTHEIGARHADAVGFVGFRHDGVGVDTSYLAPAALDRQVAHVREVAGDRADSVELAALVQRVVVSPSREAAAKKIADDNDLDPDVVLSSPYYLLGTSEEIADQLVERRDRFGISYWTVFESRGGRELAPIIDHLT